MRKLRKLLDIKHKKYLIYYGNLRIVGYKHRTKASVDSLNKFEVISVYSSAEPSDKESAILQKFSRNKGKPLVLTIEDKFTIEEI